MDSGLTSATDMLCRMQASVTVSKCLHELEDQPLFSEAAEETSTKGDEPGNGTKMALCPQNTKLRCQARTLLFLAPTAACSMHDPLPYVTMAVQRAFHHRRGAPALYPSL